MSRWTVAIFIGESLGYMLLLCTIVTQEKYNHGVGYMTGSFVISIAKELVIVSLLAPASQLEQKPNTFKAALISCFAALLFFTSALVLEFNI